MNEQFKKFNIAIAGASGFVGQAVIRKLVGKHNIFGLSRSGGPKTDGVTWRKCDLFSLKEAEAGLADCDIAIYLVHSMLPTARLTQGRFDDLDLMIADNFSRAAEKNGIKKIIYLGGIIPDGDISLHLKSRREVEDALADHGVPCITLRAGLVVGANGSSFDMMRKLVERLPMMICPKWTTTRSQPISLEDATTLISKVVEDERLEAGAYDIGGKDVLTYIDMMRKTAEAIGKKRFFVPVGIFSPKLSRLWVRLVTGAPKQLIGPLVESLRHPMIAKDDRLLTRYGIQPMTFQDSLRMALSAHIATTNLAHSKVPESVDPRRPSKGRNINTVCSVQRLPLPEGQDAKWVADKYAKWLIQFLFPIIRVKQDKQGSLSLMLQIGPKKWSFCLLQLTYAAERSSAHRQLYYIQGGLLLSSKAMEKGRFEFREVLSGHYVMAAIFDFIPALPWWLYKSTQALLHLFVMWAFKVELMREKRKEKTKEFVTN